MRVRVGIAVAAVAVVAAGACSKEGDSTTHPKAKPRPHEPGRPVEVACPAERPPGVAQPNVPGGCKQDADCTAGKNGRCQTGGPRVLANTCSYDACFRDADCTTGGPCECRADGNACLAGNCRTDADCGAGGSCGRSNAMGCGFGGRASYYCRTGDDTCGGGDCGDKAECVYVPEVGHWACKEYPTCPMG